MKTYVINLDSATKRWTRVSTLMQATGLMFERVSAVVGKQLQLPIAEFSDRKYRRYHGKRPNLGQIGCYLSHLKVLNAFLETDESFAMVCEDDITPVAQLADIVQSAMAFQNQWDILRLSGFHDSHPMKVHKLSGDYSLAVNATRLCGTGCYVVSRQAAEVLVQRLLPMRVPIDHAIDREWFYGLRAMAVDPLPVKQNPIELPSSLPANDGEKLPAWQRYWTVFPYRLLNETCRLANRCRAYQIARRSVNLSTR